MTHELIMIITVFSLQTTPEGPQSTTDPAPYMTDHVTNYHLTGDRPGEAPCRCSIQTPIPVVCTDYQTQNNSEKLLEIRHWVRLWIS